MSIPEAFRILTIAILYKNMNRNGFLIRAVYEKKTDFKILFL